MSVRHEDGRKEFVRASIEDDCGCEGFELLGGQVGTVHWA